MTSTLPTVVVVGVMESDVTVFVAMVAIFCCTVAGAADAGVGVTPSTARLNRIASAIARQCLIMPPVEATRLPKVRYFGKTSLAAHLAFGRAGCRPSGWCQTDRPDRCQTDRGWNEIDRQRESDGHRLAALSGRRVACKFAASTFWARW